MPIRVANDLPGWVGKMWGSNRISFIVFWSNETKASFVCCQSGSGSWCGQNQYCRRLNLTSGYSIETLSETHTRTWQDPKKTIHVIATLISDKCITDARDRHVHRYSEKPAMASIAWQIACFRGDLKTLVAYISVNRIFIRSNPNIRIFDVESWIRQTICLHRFVESNPRFVLEYSNIWRMGDAKVVIQIGTSP